MLENLEIRDQPFVEKEINFSLANGLKIDSKFNNCEINCFLRVNNKNYKLNSNKLSKIDAVATHLTLEVIPHDFNSIPFIEYLNIEEDLDANIVLLPKHIKQQPVPGFCIGMIFPTIIDGLPVVVQLMEPDGKIISINKSSSNFQLSKHGLNCNIPRGITYRARVAFHFEDVTSEWSNWISFKRAEYN